MEYRASRLVRLYKEYDACFLSISIHMYNPYVIYLYIYKEVKIGFPSGLSTVNGMDITTHLVSEIQYVVSWVSWVSWVGRLHIRTPFDHQ